MTARIAIVQLFEFFFPPSFFYITTLRTALRIASVRIARLRRELLRTAIATAIGNILFDTHFHRVVVQTDCSAIFGDYIDALKRAQTAE